MGFVVTLGQSSLIVFANSRVAPLVGNDASRLGAVALLCLAIRGLPLALEMTFHRFWCHTWSP